MMSQISMLTKLLPPKKPDLENPEDTDEVDLEPFKNAPTPSFATMEHEDREEDDYDEDDYDEDDDEESEGPGCQQQ